MYYVSYVCFVCKRSFKRIFILDETVKKCPLCGKDAHNVGRKFKCPKQNDTNGWRLTRYLFENGCHFSSIYESASKEILGVRIPYPKTMDEAKKFVTKYKSSWLKNSNGYKVS